MSQATSKTSCYWLIGGGITLLLLVLALFFLPWWMKMSFYSEISDTAVDRISRYQRALASRPLFEKQQQELQRKLKEHNYFIAAENPELAAADIQSKVKTIVAQSGGSLMSTQYLGKDKKHENMIQVKVRMKGKVQALYSVLFALESSLPVLKVDQLSVRSRVTAQGRGDNRVTSYSLDITFVVNGFMARSEP